MRDITDIGESFSDFRKRTKDALIKKTTIEKRNFGYASYREEPIRKFDVLLCSNEGYSMEGDPKAVFDRLLHDKQYSEYRFIWAIRNENLELLEKEYRRNRRVNFVSLGGDSYLQALAVSEYLICDTRFPVWFIRRPEQMYIQTNNRFENFIKGYDQEENYISSVRMQVKDYLCSNAVLSPGAYFTEKILQTDYKLNNLYEGNVVETIPPRFEAIRWLHQADAKKQCAGYGFTLSGKQLLLVFGKKGLVQEKIRFCKELAELLPENGYQVCVKPIPSETKPIRNALKETGVLVLAHHVNMNLILTASDYVVGDGAGYTFDFLATGRLLLFTDLYGIRKGEVLSESKLPGPTASYPEELVRFLEKEEEITGQFKENYTDCVKNFISDGSRAFLWEDGEFKKDIGRKLIAEKEKILFAAPKLSETEKENCSRWSDEFYHMLDRIDYDKYDVTVVTNQPEVFWDELDIEKRINKNVRLLYRSGLMVQTEKMHIEFKYLAYNLFFADNLQEAFALADPNECRNDWVRVCGYTTFDTLVYYGPPNAYFLLLANQLRTKRKIYYDRRNYKQLFPPQFLTDKQERRFKNLFKIDAFFDSTIHPSRDTILFLKGFEAYGDYTGHTSGKLFCERAATEDDTERSAQYQSKDYRIRNCYRFSDGQTRMTIVRKFDSSEENYSVNVPFCTITEIPGLIAVLLNIKREKPDAVFHIFDLYEQWGKRLEAALQGSEIRDCVFLYSGAEASGMENAAGVIHLERI